MKLKRTAVLLFLIIALGIALRVYNIHETPPGIFADEAENGIDAIVANETGNYEWFYTGNNGREGLFMNLIAFCFKFFGISALTLKLPAIFFGTLTILGVYLLGKELFRSERVGLISAFLTASSFWAINFSRISFRANMLPAILVLSFYFLFRGLRTKKWLDFSVAGLIFGLGLHSYISFRIAPAILIVMLAILIYNREKFLKNYYSHILFFILFSLVSAAPMLYTFFISHPEYLESRSASISILSPEVNNGHLVSTFAKSFSLSILKYNFWGDQNWRHNLPPYPLLDPLTGAAFLFGLIYAVYKFIHLLILRVTKKVRDEKLDIYLFLLAAFFFMLVPEFMTAEGNPHALRAIGTLPFVFIFAGLTLNYFFEYAEKKNYLYKKTVLIIFLLMILSVGIFNSAKYFVFWAKYEKTAQAFDSHLRQISETFINMPVSTAKYLVADEYPSRPVKVMAAGTENIYYVWPVHIEHIKPMDNDFVIILVDPTTEDKEKILEKFPDIKMETKKKAGSGYYLEFRFKN